MSIQNHSHSIGNSHKAKEDFAANTDIINIDRLLGGDDLFGECGHGNLFGNCDQCVVKEDLGSKCNC